MAGVAYYSIAGKQVGGHYIAMGWLASLYLGVKFATSGGPSKTNVAATPPINASSSDEADFIKKFLDEQDKKN
ncbi:hypothetical protein BGZ61DRAFT_527462 [Ilyonectria robusta]|uniref:uncharacterized protein n=1 Tax=Ilyonectria robusta TaxID=1079257 RepID=UPI001E8D5776|nr:uncharacterized protein BGZ61DRAFT_527462 [Ilyonectria robusta]KAH6995604.1 hypothetical protein BKA56DRAFT_665915 [Ilyonectria sp. MPI-CAGE-AT-0026]KAH7016814.1 hypothetical protein EDB80DRAFT_703516 [Ilyonectria destructans]KAH8736522.1 hypothetical protein BGZ61DRAFT_527462 [Ilyonectria robusta]